MRGSRLSNAGLSLLAFVAAEGPVPRSVLLQAQRARHDGRTEGAIGKMPEGLRALGLLQHVPDVTPRMWELTPRGRDAVRAWAQHPERPRVSLGVASHAVLEFLVVNGPCESRRLFEVQASALPGRKKSASAQLVCELVRRGLTVKASKVKPCVWTITDRGRAALTGSACATEPSQKVVSPLMSRPARPTSASPARCPAVSTVPRWVFDLAPQGDGS